MTFLVYGDQVYLQWTTLTEVCLKETTEKYVVVDFRELTFSFCRWLFSCISVFGMLLNCPRVHRCDC